MLTTMLKWTWFVRWSIVIQLQCLTFRFLLTATNCKFGRTRKIQYATYLMQLNVSIHVANNVKDIFHLWRWKKNDICMFFGSFIASDRKSSVRKWINDKDASMLLFRIGLWIWFKVEKSVLKNKDNVKGNRVLLVSTLLFA